MKKIILILITIITITSCSNMLNDLAQVELNSGDKLILTGTDGAAVTGIAIDSDADGTADGIDVTGNGAADFTIIAADSTPSAGVYAVDTNDDGQTDMYISVSSTGTSTINTATDGTGTAVTVAVASDGTVSLDGETGETTTGTGTGTPTVAATTDINGDGSIDAEDTAILSKLTFTVTGDTVSITGADSSISGVLNIPAEYDGKAVTSIGNEAFKDCSALTAVTIPSSITAIGASAFGGCSELDSITMLAATAPTASLDILDGIAAPVSLSYPAGASGYDDAGTVWIDNAEFYKSDDQNGDGIVDASDTALVAKLTFIITGDEATLTGVTDTSISGTLNIPTEYDGHPVTAIGNDAFKDCTALASITIPAGVSSIGDQAFQNCSALSDLSMLEAAAPTTGTNVFDGITGVVTLNYPTTSTGYEAAGTPWVDTSVFHKTGDVNGDGIIDNVDITLSTELTFTITGEEATLTGITNTAIAGELIIPATYEGKPVTAIANEALKDCSALTSITIPDGVTDIGFRSFANCSALTTLNIPDSVTAIEPAAFELCTSLTSVTLPSGITAIYNSFNNCTALTTISIPSGVTTIGGSAFEGCSALSSVTIPTTVTTISDAAFKDCSALTSISLPDNVTELSSETFNGCTSLSIVTMPANLTTINDSAFKDCSAITTFTIPEDVSVIGDTTFQNCANLSSITLLPTTAPTVGTDAFDGISNRVTLSYPSGSTGYDIAGTPWVDSTLFYNNNDQNGDGVIDADDTDLLAKLTFTISDDEATLTGVTDTSISGTLNIPAIYGGSPVTTIDRLAFYNCTSLTAVTMPASITTFGDMVFHSCTGLTSLTMLSTTAPSTGTNTFYAITTAINSSYPSGATGYDSAPWASIHAGDLNGDSYVNARDLEILEKLTFTETATEVSLTDADTSITGSFVIPSTFHEKPVTSIDSNAFENCISLNYVEIPESVVSIGDSAFLNCSGLNGLRMNKATAPSASTGVFSGVTNAYLMISTGATGYDVAPWNNNTVFRIEGDLDGDGDVDADDTTLLGLLTFEITSDTEIKLTGITDNTISGTLVIPYTHDGRTVTMLGDACLKDCTLLTNIIVPEGVTTVRHFSFQGCTSLESITMSSNTNVIYMYAFEGCSSLPSFTLPSVCTYLGDYVFQNCISLTTVNLTSEITEIKDRTFESCTSLISITLPSGITNIGDYAFRYCSNLTSIELPAGLKTMDSFIFAFCDKLESINFPSGLTGISYAAFQHCIALSSVTIPSNITTIGNYAFQECSTLTTVTMEANTAPTVTDYGFSSLSDDCTLRIPSGATGYNVGPWTTRFSTIETY